MKKSKGYPYAIKESKSVSAYSGYTIDSSLFFTLTIIELKDTGIVSYLYLNHDVPLLARHSLKRTLR